MPFQARIRARILLAAAPLAVLASVTTVAAAPASSADAARCHRWATGSWTPNCTVRKGARNRYVDAIQLIVDSQEICPTLNIDGVFGAKTKKGVKCFQREYKIRVTGVVNSNTWKTMRHALYYHDKKKGWKYYYSLGIGSVDFKESVKTGAWYYGGPKASSKWVRMNEKAPDSPYKKADPSLGYRG